MVLWKKFNFITGVLFKGVAFGATLNIVLLSLECLIGVFRDR